MLVISTTLRSAATDDLLERAELQLAVRRGDLAQERRVLRDQLLDSSVALAPALDRDAVAVGDRRER